jgi:hypothetical protein
MLIEICGELQKEPYKLIKAYSEDMYMNCHNLAKHTEFYLG